MKKITKEQIEIKLKKQVFSFYESDDQDKIDKILKQKEAFINKVFFVYEIKIGSFRIEHEVYYYVGNVS